MATNSFPALEIFITRWQGREGGQERANYAMFLTEFCAALGLPPPEPASAASELNDYVFERVVGDAQHDGSTSRKRIDLYKRDCFVLEAKQSRQKPGEKLVSGQLSLFAPEPEQRGKATARKDWDVLMQNARAQAENYVRLLPKSHEPPPFVILADVGHCFEFFANFRRDGKAYDQFPDRQSFRVYLEDLRDENTRKRIAAVWTQPMTLDPARESARVTREIAKRLAEVSKALEAQGHDAEEVAMFLMRCLFTMFAEDVELLPRQSFKQVLERCEADPSTFPHDVGQLWEAMDVGGYAHAIRRQVVKFNGQFFRRKTVLPLERAEIGELRQAASYNWKDVDPSIFGTLLEQALNVNERRKLGAHYTPRAYVERLVIATIIEPLREDWKSVLGAIERKRADMAALGPFDPRRETLAKEARELATQFHGKLCHTRVLDPACGTGNFLYVALELMKRLEGEVIDAVESLGGQEGAIWLDRQNVDPHQFLGLEINPRAAAIAELVLWIGFLQWHFRTRSDPPPPPILKAFRNIQVKDAVLEADVTLARDERGKAIVRRGADGEEREVYEYRNPRRPEWPEAEFIVGNPPFIGKGGTMRAAFGQPYLDALYRAYPEMHESADFVMFWWEQCATILRRPKGILNRFGLVTTNSISQSFNRRVLERNFEGKDPISLIYAIADHPWTKVTEGAAAVRIAMTVAVRGLFQGIVLTLTREQGLNSDSPILEFKQKMGQINSDLSIGSNISLTSKLLSAAGLSTNGMLLAGRGFLISEQLKDNFFAINVSNSNAIFRPYMKGRGLIYGWTHEYVIDCFGLDVEELREQFPSIYQHLRLTVAAERMKVAIRTQVKDAQDYAKNWWLFAKNRRDLRDALSELPKYIATTETSKHRIFQFVDVKFLPDHMVVTIALSDAFFLGVLSSRTHVLWALRAGAWLGVGNDPRYSKSRCFDPFPFPAADDLQKQRIRAVAEELDAHRKRVLAEHPHLTLTGLYNVLEKLKAGTAPDALNEPDRRIFDDGLVLILKEHHEKLDALVAAAYGWPVDLPDEDILSRLVALNKERAAEEARGLVRWLRPEYQIPRFGAPQEKAQLELAGLEPAAKAAVAGPKADFPKGEVAQTAAVMAALAAASAPLDANALAATFKQGRRVAPQIAAVLAALTRLGFVASSDAGRTFALRRAA